MLDGAYKWQRPARLGISPSVLGLHPAQALELEPDAENRKLGRGGAQRRAGAARRVVLPVAHREPPPARAGALSRQAACLRLPPPSISLESQPGAPAPRRFSGWGSPRPLSGFTSSSQPGLAAPSLPFLDGVPPASVPSR